MHMNKMLFSEELQNVSKKIKIENLDMDFEKLHTSIDIKEEMSIKDIEQMDFRLEELHHSVDIKDESPIIEVLNTEQMKDGNSVDEFQLDQDCCVELDEVCGNENYQEKSKCQTQPKCKMTNRKRRVNQRKHFLQTHVKEKPCKRKTCNLTSIYLQTLKEHLKLAHNGKNWFVCIICGYKCIQRGCFISHLETHADIPTSNGEKLFACEICDYTSFERPNFLLHLKTHSILKNNNNVTTRIGDKRFACEMCGFKCSLKGHLKIHLKNLIGEKSFKCEKCGFEWKMLTK